jgi:hypothetical protein
MSAPTLTIADNGDETALATIGNAAGATVELFAQVDGAWASQGTRSGNGTITATLTPAGYWWKATATTAGAGTAGSDEVIDVGPIATAEADTVEPRICMMSSSTAIWIYDGPNNPPRALKARGASLGTDGRWTLGNEVTITSNSYGVHKVVRMDATHAIVVYDKIGANGSAKCLTLSGTAVSAGAERTFASGSFPSYPGLARMDDTNAIVAYTASGSVVMKCLTLSGTSLSDGAAATISDATYNAVALASLTSSSATLAAKTSAGALTAAAVALTGTTIEPGEAITVATGIAGNVCSDGLSSTQSILCWKAGTGYTSGAVLTVDGATVLAGAVAQSTDAATTGVSSVTSLSASVALSASAGSQGATIRSAAISGGAITWSSTNAVAGASGDTLQTDIDAISATRAVVTAKVRVTQDSACAQEITYIPAVAAVAGTDTVQTSPVVWQRVTSADSVGIIDLCDDLVTYLNEEVLDEAWAERKWLGKLDYGTIGADPIVEVKPDLMTSERSASARNRSDVEWTVLVVVHWRVDDGDLDAAVGLLTDIEASLRRKTLGDFTCMTGELPVLWDAATLSDHGIFRGAVKTTWRQTT